jgi:hypothetical protein
MSLVTKYQKLPTQKKVVIRLYKDFVYSQHHYYNSKVKTMNMIIARVTQNQASTTKLFYFQQ